jgi:hypothetical protein
MLARFFSKMMLSPKEAELIFDRDEPVGRPTDMVMPRPRWFRRKNVDARPAQRVAKTPPLNS